jgi:GNAT superfamily N-acetyltransferase
MERGASRYEIKELSAETWPDFERLFSRGNGWDFCWCMGFQRGERASRQEFRTRAEVSVVNHERKKQVVDEGRTHGILVYAGGQPVGWCQYGPTEELLGRRGAHGEEPAWRVTCFVVDKRYRRSGVAGRALRAALESIRNQGGGLVEAYPVASWTHGRGASTEPVKVQGVGPVAPAWGGFQNVSTSGVASMFEKEGFTAVGICGSTSRRVRSYGAAGDHVVMHKRIITAAHQAGAFRCGQEIAAQGKPITP